MQKDQIIIVVCSALSAGTIIAFVAKTFFVNYLKRNDEKHDKANEQIINLRIEIAKMEKWFELSSQKTREDLFAAHEKIRQINKDL